MTEQYTPQRQMDKRLFRELSRFTNTEHSLCWYKRGQMPFCTFTATMPGSMFSTNHNSLFYVLMWNICRLGPFDQKLTMLELKLGKWPIPAM